MAVTLNPGDNIASIVAANPAGTTYNFNPGTYRFQGWNAKQNDVYQAATLVLGSVILTGARVLTGWTVEAPLWFIGGQTQQGSFNASGPNPLPGHDGAPYPEQLWVDGTLYEHVTTKAAVSAGKWFFDYALDRIYIPINPTGHTIETSVTQLAIVGPATGVTVRKLTIEKYANGASVPVVGTGAGWLVENNEVRHSHGLGIKVGANGIMRGNYVHHMGQLGISASGQSPQILGNEVSYNNTAFFGYGSGEECGGTKFVLTTDALVQGNLVHHNFGPGLWNDVNNIRSIVDNNIVEDNDWRGIFDEVGYNTIIRNNQVRRNGLRNPNPTPGAVGSAGILVSCCRDVTVHSNIVEDNAQGICGQDTDRPLPALPTGFGSHDLVNLNVYNNDVRQLTGKAAGATNSDPNANPFSVAANNKWHDNRYVISASTSYQWSAGSITQAAWQAIPQDAGSTFGTASAVPALLRGQWHYDGVRGLLYVRCTDGLSPATKRMVVFDQRFGTEEIVMVNVVGTLKGRLCRHFSFVSSPTVDVDAARGGAVAYDGSLVAFTTNWGGQPSTGVYVVLTDPNA